MSSQSNSMLVFPSAIWENYRNHTLEEGFNLCPIPSHFDLPKTARLITHMPGDEHNATPSVRCLGNMSAYAKAYEVKYAKNALLRHSRKYDKISFQNEEEIWGVIRDINLNPDKLSTPFAFSYLEEFQVVIKKPEMTVSYRRSRLSPFFICRHHGSLSIYRWAHRKARRKSALLRPRHFVASARQAL